MAKFADDSVLDAPWNMIAAAATRQVLCSSQPANFAAVAAASLADVAVDSSDFSNANGDVSGRKMVVAAQNGVLIDASGNGTHIALVNDTGSVLLYVTTCTSLAVVANGSNTVNMPSWDAEFRDPA